MLRAGDSKIKSPIYVIVLDHIDIKLNMISAIILVYGPVKKLLVELWCAKVLLLEYRIKNLVICLYVILKCEIICYVHK